MWRHEVGIVKAGMQGIQKEVSALKSVPGPDLNVLVSLLSGISSV